MTLAPRLRAFARQYAVIARDGDGEMIGYAGGNGSGQVVFGHLAARKFTTYPDALVWALAARRHYPDLVLDVVGLIDAPD